MPQSDTPLCRVVTYPESPLPNPTPKEYCEMILWSDRYCPRHGYREENEDGNDYRH